MPVLSLRPFLRLFRMPASTGRGMRNRVLAAVVSLGVGAACIWAAASLLASLSRPDLYLQVVDAGPDRGLLLRFTNTGLRDVALDAAGMDCLAMPPVEAGGEPVLAVLPEPYDERDPGAPLRRDGVARLAPGERVHLAVRAPAAAGAPWDRRDVIAIYAPSAAFPPPPGCWRGFVRSAPPVLTTGGP